MNGPLSIPPPSHADLSPGYEIARRLAPLIGKPFQLTGKTRTDGSNQTVRYLIALSDAKTGLRQGVVLCPGRRLAEHFVYVAERSFKCQRSIPMAFFDRFEGQAVFNPAYP
jgi:hypothetical protein